MCLFIIILITGDIEEKGGEPKLYNRKKILVTGGAGFIGSHLCKRLIEDGHQVICVDNLFTGQLSNLNNLFTHPGFEFIEQDIIGPFDVEVDEIYNLACPASPVHYMKDPVKTVQTNVIGAINMLELAKKYNAKILQTSTSEVYGDPQIHPQKENYWGNVNPIGPRACYDEGKRCAETLFFDYYRNKGVNIRVVRIFNTYGPNMMQGDGRVVSNFILQALQNKDITVYGTGSQTRSFCYISDLIEGMIAFMKTNSDFPGPINLGNPDEFTIKDFAEIVIQATDSQSKIIYQELPVDDPRVRKPEIGTANKIIGWKPKISLLEGLGITIKYFKNILVQSKKS